MRSWMILVVVGLGCDDGGGDPLSCGQLVDQCPPGSSAILGEQANASCQAAQGGISVDGSGQANGQCLESSACRVLCQFDVPCRCGVAAITRAGIECARCDGAAACGNGVCEGGETPERCPIDCGALCEPDERRCDGAALQICNLQGRWDDLPCPSGEACTALDGPPRCDRDVQIIDEGDSGIDDDGGIDRPMDGRIIPGEGEWPESRFPLPPPTPREFVFAELRLHPASDEGAQLRAAFERLGGERMRLVPGADRLEGHGTQGTILLDADLGTLVMPPAPPLDAESRAVICAGFVRCIGQPDDQCDAWIAEEAATRGGGFAACMVAAITENPAICLPFIASCPWNPIHPYPGGVELRPNMLRRGARVLGESGGVPQAIDLAAHEAWQMDPIGEYSLRFGTAAVDLSRDGRVAAMIGQGGLDQIVVYWPIGSPRRVILPTARGGASQVRLSPDGQVIALARTNTGDPDSDGAWSFWLAETEQRLFSVLPFEGSVMHELRFSPDGRHAAFSMTRPTRIEVWDLQARERTRIVADAPDARPQQFQFSPDGSYLVVVGEGSPELWDVRSGQRFATFDNLNGLLNWQGDGARFMTGAGGQYSIAEGQ